MCIRDRCSVARVAGGRLDRHAARGIDVHVEDFDRDIEPTAQLGAGAREIGRGGLQPVIDVHGANRQAGSACFTCRAPLA